MECPVARTLDEVGEWWSILILRDAFHGLTRFDQFVASLGIAPNMLTRRLRALVERGLLDRRPYSERPIRHEYVLTGKGRDFLPVLLALLEWGNKHVAGPDGPAILAIDAISGKPIEPVMVDRGTLKPLKPSGIRLAAGPGAGPEIRDRIDRANAHAIAAIQKRRPDGEHAA